jgi:hypothetical protein
MRPPRSPSLPSATAHPGEDNGTRTRTAALTTRRLSLRLCPRQGVPGRTGMLVPPGGLEPPLHGLRARRAALTPRRERDGANDRIRTDTSRLGRPAGSRYPTFALDRPTGIEPVPPRWRRGMLPPHPGRTLRAGVVHRPSTSFSCQRPRSFANTRMPTVRPVVGDSARIRTRTHEIWRLGCSPLHHTVLVNSIVP